MSRSKYGHRTTNEFAGALEHAAKDPEAPQPHCVGKSAQYTEFTTPPDADAAEAMCAPCPLREMCFENARRTKAKWGVWGGVAWVGGRHAHLIDQREEDWREWGLEDFSA